MHSDLWSYLMKLTHRNNSPKNFNYSLQIATRTKESKHCESCWNYDIDFNYLPNLHTSCCFKPVKPFFSYSESLSSALFKISWLCSTEGRKSYRFGMTWVNNVIISFRVNSISRYWLKVLAKSCIKLVSAAALVWECVLHFIHLALFTCFLLLMSVMSWPSESYLYTMSTVLS